MRSERSNTPCMECWCRIGVQRAKKSYIMGWDEQERVSLCLMVCEGCRELQRRNVGVEGRDRGATVTATVSFIGGCFSGENMLNRGLLNVAASSSRPLGYPAQGM